MKCQRPTSNEWIPIGVPYPHRIVLLQTFRMKIIIITALGSALVNRLITTRFTQQKETTKNTNYNKLTMLMPIPYVILFIKVDGNGISTVERLRNIKYTHHVDTADQTENEARELIPIIIK